MAEAGQRIAKLLARAGIGSRRAVERMIGERRVALGGRIVESPAFNLASLDGVTVDGKPVTAPLPTRLWRYHKPRGVLVSHEDPRGRLTVFSQLPAGFPRVVSVGRLDFNSEGLLLLTNDGELKRRLELPSTGWIRRYRVRVHGHPHAAAMARLARGVTVLGVRYEPIEAAIERQRGDNAWLAIALREGKNREVRRVLESIGLTVNRLIRIAYGPFQLGGLEPGEVVAVPRKVLQDQLGAWRPDDRADRRRPA
ncbi:MAG: rRNA pseudouridine synthase [Alphaproteobacteria bacterium]|nr:rRNA pseudouridine synthase [Alphaproteobacteria bacterium]